MIKKIKPIHPGEVLKEEFLEPLGVTKYRLAKDISVSAMRIGEITHGARAVTPDSALRLGRYFGTSARFWLNLQNHYDLEERSWEIIRLSTSSGANIMLFYVL